MAHKVGNPHYFLNLNLCHASRDPIPSVHGSSMTQAKERRKGYNNPKQRNYNQKYDRSALHVEDGVRLCWLYFADLLTNSND
jgi:hypothetical protein